MTQRDKLLELRKIKCPICFEFVDKPFVVEIQYFHGNEIDLGYEDNDYLVFATNADAVDLLIKADFSSNEILQKEFDDVDFIDVTLDDLLSAKHS